MWFRKSWQIGLFLVVLLSCITGSVLAAGSRVTELPETFPTTDITYYGRWTALPSTITFNLDGGSGATNCQWQWHKPSAVDDLKADCLKKGFWVDEGRFINKDPAAPDTSVNVIEQSRDSATGEITLRIVPINGDIVHYEIDSDATEASSVVRDLSSFKTNELVLSFLCVDSNGVNTTGAPFTWTNKVEIKHRYFDQNGQTYMELVATSPHVSIHYSTDGTNPENGGGVYVDPFVIADGVVFIQAVAFNKKNEVCSKVFDYAIKKESFSLVADLPVRLTQPLKLSSTKETFAMLEELGSFGAVVKGVDVVVQETKNNANFMTLGFGGFEIPDVGALVSDLTVLIDKFFGDNTFDATATINNVCFETGTAFEQWVSKQGTTVDSFKNKISQ